MRAKPPKTPQLGQVILVSELDIPFSVIFALTFKVVAALFIMSFLLIPLWVILAVLLS